MDLRKTADTHGLTVFLLATVLSGSACFILARAPVPRYSGSEVEKSVVSVAMSVPQPVSTEAYLPYVWRYSDHYETVKGRARLRPQPLPKVRAPFTLVWEGDKEARVQVSNDARFSGLRRHLSGQWGWIELSKVFVGENHWRVSRDGKIWSESMKFTVEPEFLPGRVEIQRAAGEVRVSASVPITGYLIEYSPNQDFKQVSVHVRAEPRPRMRIPRPGYVRARAYNAQGELTEYSSVMPVGL